MNIPKIDSVYIYNGETVIVWQQDLFRKVYLRTVPNDDGSKYLTENWWKFMFSAKKLGEYINNTK